MADASRKRYDPRTRAQRAVKVIGALLSVSILAACGPESPIAVGPRTPPGSFEVRSTECNPRPVKQVTIIVPGRGAADPEHDKRLWQISFRKPKELRSLTIGATPPGAVELVPWSGFQGAREIGVNFDYANGSYAYSGVKVTRLRPNAVIYEGKSYSTKEFSHVNCVAHERAESGGESILQPEPVL